MLLHTISQKSFENFFHKHNISLAGVSPFKSYLLLVDAFNQSKIFGLFISLFVNDSQEQLETNFSNIDEAYEAYVNFTLGHQKVPGKN